MRRKQDGDNQAATERPGRRFRRRYVGLVTVALLLAATFAAPIIVAKTELRNTLIGWAASDLEGEIQIGSASLNWFATLELRDIRLLDATGLTVAEVEVIRSEKPLLALIGNRHQLGKFTVQRPRVSVEIRKGGSNLEDVLQNLLEEEQDQAPTEVQCSIDIVDGELALKKKGHGDALKIEQLSAQVSVDLGSQQPFGVVVTGITREQKHEGRFETELTSTKHSTEVSFATERLPLKLFGLALLRFGTEANLGGDLDADMELAYSPGEMSVLTVRRFEARQVTAEAVQWLGQDRLALDVLKASGRTLVGGGQLQLDQCGLESDLARLEANGTFSLDALATGNVVGFLGDHDFRVDGKVDVGRLANMLPNTLSLKDDTRITGGSVEVNAFSRVEADRRRWVATLATSALTAVSGDRNISWDQPLQVTLAAADSRAGPEIETLTCRSDFLTATAKGTLHNGSLTANGNLDRLAEQLGRFVDLGKLQLAGGLSATANWEQQAGGRVRFLGNVVLSSFALSTPEGRPWTEERLTLDGDLTAVVGGRGVERLEAAQLVLHAGEDHLEVRQAGVPQYDAQKGSWPFSATLTGNLATWTPRLQPWISLSSWRTSGRISLTASGQVEGESLLIQTADMQVDEFQLDGHGVRLREPQVIVQASGSWNMNGNRLAVQGGTLTSSTVSLRADAAEAHFGKAIEFAGDVAYRCDLVRLATWFRDTTKQPSIQIAGHLTGNANVRFEKQLLSALVKAQVHDFSLLKKNAPSSETFPVARQVNPWEKVWHEKTIAIDGDASFDLARGNLNLKKTKIAGESLAMEVDGTLGEFDQRCTADLRGTLDYDLATVSRALQSLLGPNVTFAGRERGSFVIRGPLIQPRSEPSEQTARNRGLVGTELAGEAKVGWSTANLYGFAIGRGMLTATLREGVVEFEPLKVAVGKGRVDVTPRVYLNSEPASLVVDNGRILENVEITPEISRGWLKFVAPIVADATEAQGTFSLDLAGAKLPLAAPSQGNVRGTLQIHGATVGPGPVGRELLVLGQQIQGLIRGQALTSLVGTQGAQWVQLPQQQVEFHLVDGRVHHQNLQLVVGDVAIVTSGSVGIDQSVNMVARIAIRDNWIAANGLLAGLKGTTLEIPIKGTLARPLADSRVVANVARQYFRGAAERAVEREIQKGLEQGLQQLFGPPR